MKLLVLVGVALGSWGIVVGIAILAVALTGCVDPACLVDAPLKQCGGSR